MSEAQPSAHGPTPPAPFIVTIGFRGKPGKAAELERELRNRVPISRTEAGTLDYRLYRSTSDDHLFFLFSRYISEKSFDVHLYQPYSLSMLAEMEELLSDPPRVETYTTVLG
jgi:quinol monooxygenase YgiN